MEKILIILPNNLGDVIMALPVLEGIKKKYQGCNVSFLVEEGFDGGLINFQYCDNIISFNRKKVRDLIKGETWVKGIDELNSFIAPLQHEKFDLVINLCQIQYISFITTLIKGRKNLGQVFLPEGNHAVLGKWSTYLYAIPFARNFNALHATDIYKRIAGVSDITEFSGIRISSDESAKIQSYLNGKLKKIDAPIAIFHPGAAYESKRWPVEYYIELGKMIIRDGFNIVITGAQSERDLAIGIKSQLGDNCLITSGELSFRESIALLSASDFCVTSDTAVMHAASALNKKVYAMFGPTSPVETGPYSSGNIIFAGRCRQRPCFCSQCKSKLCMKSILPQSVYSFIRAIPDTQTSCDVYRTTFEDSVFSLVPIIENGTPYYLKTGASVTRKSIESQLRIESASPGFQEISDESKRVISIVTEMKSYLNTFLVTRNSDYIKKFEAAKKDLVANNGIGNFWAALLNIQLNSIPLLDPFYGINESIKTCDSLIKQIEAAISV